MKTYFVKLTNQSGETFTAEFSSTAARLALDAAMDAAQAGLKLTPFVQVLDEKNEIVWGSLNEHA